MLSPAAGTLSPWGMVLAADPVVQSVMAALALGSVATWTVTLVKLFELARARRRARQGLTQLRRLPALAVPADGVGIVARMIAGAVDETRRLPPGAPTEGIKERVALALNRQEAGAGRRIGSGLGILAIIANTGPFVGLFGTVWGIMNSFIAIADAHTTQLAVVAPGIAEALLATAIGLVAAIPASMFYNLLTRSISGYRAMLGDVSAEILRLVSRDLDRQPGAGQWPG